jgi:hypothetical protein
VPSPADSAPPPAPDPARRDAAARPRLAVVLVVVLVAGWLAVRAVGDFDQDRHVAEAAAVLSARDTVTHELPPAHVEQTAPQPGQDEQAAPQPGQPGRTAPPPADAGSPEREGSPQPGTGSGAVHTPGTPGTPGTSGTPGGRLAYRPGTWLTVVELRDLEPVGDDERYLVFLRNWAGWTLAGAARPDAAGAAQVRSAAEPRPPTIYEVVVTRAVDDATSVPHGQPVLHWYDGSIAPPRARPFDFARGA